MRRLLAAALLVLTACAPDPAGPRGWEWSESSCPGPPWYPPAPHTAKPLPDDVSLYTVCPAAGGGSHVNVAAGTARFERLTRALSAPYVGREPKRVCTAQLELDVPVWARSGDRVYLVRLPKDECGHYRKALREAL